jgi:GTP-binding protein
MTLHVRFITSAAAAGDFPHTGVPEVALVGRSNVGKSSLINALAKQKVARTSAAPGKTRLANYYLAGPAPGTPSRGVRPPAAGAFYLVDLPGYGYARGGAESSKTFEQLTREYFERADPRRVIAGVLQLIDARHPDLQQDGAAFEWLSRLDLRTAIVATKVDKLKRSEQLTIARTLEARYGIPVIPVSSASGAGLNDVRALLQDLLGSLPEA